MAKHEYRDRYFEEPSGFDFIKEDFLADLADRVQNALVEAGEDEVVALTGIGTLFGFVHVSDLIGEVEPEIQGRLVVFFPGRHEQNTYRLLDARDGWDYLAMPIKA
nr:BREX protein BrxB domain-containing protein [Salinibacter ruber]